jgi:hypothetical protein
MLTHWDFIRHCGAELKYPSVRISCARETAKSVSYILSIAFIVSFTLLSRGVKGVPSSRTETLRT